MTPTSRRGLWLGVTGLVVAALVIPKLVSNAKPAETPAPRPAAAPLEVEVVRLAPASLTERLATTGTLRADEQVELVSEIAGKVAAVHFEEGQPVRAGDLLLEIDDSALQAQREAIVHRLELAEKREARQQELRAQGVVSEQEHDLAASELAVLKAQLAEVEVQIAKTDLRAPFGGVVGLRAVSLGAYLSPQTRIATLQDLDPIKLELSVPEKYVGVVAVGQPVEFRVRGSDDLQRGTIYAIEPGVDRETRSLTVRAKCPNPGARLRPGAFADVELVVRDEPSALAVPAIAIVPELGGKKVFVVDAEGTVAERRVETGIRTADRVQVTSGLAAGEDVVVSGVQRLRSGMKVQVARKTGLEGDVEATAPVTPEAAP